LSYNAVIGKLSRKDYSETVESTSTRAYCIVPQTTVSEHAYVTLQLQQSTSKADRMKLLSAVSSHALEARGMGGGSRLSFRYSVELCPRPVALS